MSSFHLNMSDFQPLLLKSNYLTYYAVPREQHNAQPQGEVSLDSVLKFRKLHLSGCISRSVRITQEFTTNIESWCSTSTIRTGVGAMKNERRSAAMPSLLVRQLGIKKNQCRLSVPRTPLFPPPTLLPPLVKPAETCMGTTKDTTQSNMWRYLRVE